MSEVKLHAKATSIAPTPKNPLPQLLHTPSGLALLELQGTINLPPVDENNLDTSEESGGYEQQTPIGRLIFPDYHPEAPDANSTAWMKRVYLYVGKHQRLTGEVKKLPKAIAVIRKRSTGNGGVLSIDTDMSPENGEGPADELEVVEIIKWKILFPTRPEPVGTWTGEA